LGFLRAFGVFWLRGFVTRFRGALKFCDKKKKGKKEKKWGKLKVKVYVIPYHTSAESLSQNG
jgi:hypothetical protein